jgi:Tol biopolymer transport system component
MTVRRLLLPLVVGCACSVFGIGALLAPGATAKAPGANGQIVFTRFDDTGSHVFVADADGTDARQLPPDDADLATWSPNGSRIALNICCPDDVPPRPATINADGTGFQLLSVPDLPADAAVSCRAWSPDGTRLLCQVMSDADHSLDGIYTLRASDGAVLQRLTVNPYPPTGDFGGGDIPGDFSPDGTQFVFMRAKPGAGPVPDRNQSGALFIENADGTGLHQITPYGLANSHDNGSARWSPDGAEILFAGIHARFNGGTLYTVRTDGTGLRAIPLDTAGVNATAFTPGWSPDGSKIIFSLFTTTGPETFHEGIFTADADGAHLSRVTQNEEAFYDSADWGTHPAP